MQRYDGTINQFLGDGFMALFGAPIAQEDHARRAVLAALGIAAAAEVKVRIGINSGLVVVGAIGDDLRVDYTAVGDTTVLAARLQAAAAPGAVLVSQRTAEAGTWLLRGGGGRPGPGQGAHGPPAPGDRTGSPDGAGSPRVTS